MRNKLKLMVMIVLSMIILTGCTSKSPSDVVEAYFSEIKKGESTEVENYILNTMEKDKESKDDKKENPKMDEVLKLYMSKLDAKVLGENIKNDEASVEVELTGPNFSNITMELLQESLANAFSGSEINEDDMGDSMLEKIKSEKLETRKGKINLSKVDKEWKIKNDEDSAALILGRTKNLSNMPK